MRFTHSDDYIGLNNDVLSVVKITNAARIQRVKPKGGGYLTNLTINGKVICFNNQDKLSLDGTATRSNFALALASDGRFILMLEYQCICRNGFELVKCKCESTNVAHVELLTNISTDYKAREVRQMGQKNAAENPKDPLSKYFTDLIAKEDDSMKMLLPYKLRLPGSNSSQQPLTGTNKSRQFAVFGAL